MDSNPHVIRFLYYSDGKVVAYKERDKEKNFTWKGKNEDHQLFGQQNFGSKTIVITEGSLMRFLCGKQDPTGQWYPCPMELSRPTRR